MIILRHIKTHIKLNVISFKLNVCLKFSLHKCVIKLVFVKNYNFGIFVLYEWRLFKSQHFKYTSLLQFKPNDKHSAKPREKCKCK